MDTTILRYFLAVAEHRNFTEAAKHLYITQSALSHLITNLEKELDAKLFIRTTRSVSLTPAGEILQANARNLLNQFDNLLGQIHEAESGVSGVLKIGYLTAPFRKILPDMIVRFKQTRPKIKIQYAHQNLSELHESLLHGMIDIAFTMSFDIGAANDIAWTPLNQDGMCLALRKEHPMNEASQIDFTALASEPFVMLDEPENLSFHDLTLKVCASRGFIPRIVKRSPTVESVFMDVEAGFGVAIIPSSIAAGYLSDLAFIELDGVDTVFTDVIAWRKENLNPCIPLFVQFFNRYYSKIPA